MEKTILLYFRKSSCLVEFPPAPENSVKFMQVVPFYLKLKFLVEKLMELH